QPVVTSTKANGYRLDKWFKLQTNGRINVIIPWINGLTLQGNIAVDKAFNNVKVFHKPWFLYNWDGNSDHITVPGKVGIVAPTLTQATNEALQVTMNSYLSYDHTFNGVHNVRAQAGVEKQTIDTALMTARRENYLSPAVDQLFAGAADEFMTNNGSASHSSRLSYFGRLGYDFSNKYLLEFTWRYDGSYIFPKAKRFGFFPGVAGAWRASKEKFWQENIHGIDEFKLRASWGQTGNDRITPFQYLSTYGFSGNYIYNVDDLVNNLIELRVPNPNVTWEVANQSNVAMEMGFLNNRLTLTLEYFYNVRSQILWIRNASIPASGGLRLPPENIGKVNNKGWEGIIEYRGSLGQFKYNAFLSGSFQKNKIVFWDETPGVPEYQKSTGRPMGSQLHYVSLGIFSDQGAVDKYPHWPGARPGDVIYQDVNGDNEINGLDQVRNPKSDLPTFTGSFSLNLQYKQFDLSLLVQGASGSQKYITIEGGESGNFYKLWADNRWTSENTNTSYARTWDQTVPYWDNTRNSYWLYSSDYARLKNVEIGYTLPLGLSKRVRIDGMRVYLSALNLFTVSELTKKKMMDPESLDNYAYPLNKIINVGLTLNF
ncbi:MAG TPA: SusC/RagA family TonB-linked outer membrane protein, partial [Chryseolinea sp.]|nr:SusC/RagA family TonB-linked outer membrane protein [Chryseolinea sp.]